MNLSSLYYSGGAEKFKLFLKRNQERGWRTGVYMKIWDLFQEYR